MTPGNISEVLVAPRPLTQGHQVALADRTLIGAMLGPIAAMAVFLLPLGIDATAQRALAIVVFMVVYWIAEPIDHAMTALFGCYLFWAFGVAKFSVAFGGFATTTPWFLFGALLMGEAVFRTGLAKRLGTIIMCKAGTSYSQLLFGTLMLALLLNFLIPSGIARITVIAPMLAGIVAAFGLGPRSNVGKGLFITLTYACGLFDKLIMSGAATLLTQGIIEEQTGVRVLWSQWLFAFLPATLMTVLGCWFTIRWFYPAEKEQLPGGEAYLQDSLRQMGPWSRNEKKALFWLLLAVGLWATDFIHHTNPAMIALGAALLLTLPKVGVLDTKVVRELNFLTIIFSAGALSMGSVLVETKALHDLTDSIVRWMGPLLSNSLSSAVTLYWSGFLYHFFLANEQSMLSTTLPVLLQVADTQGYNPIALGMIWTFAVSGKLFVYQSSVLVVGYSYGYFEPRDLIKVGAVLTIFEGVLLMMLVSFYWPLIGLHWIW